MPQNTRHSELFPTEQTQQEHLNTCLDALGRLEKIQTRLEALKAEAEQAPLIEEDYLTVLHCSISLWRAMRDLEIIL